MLRSEARTLYTELEILCKTAEIESILNVGSSTEDFRSRVQPYISEVIFAPLASKFSPNVFHLDAKQGSGVDIVGDFLDEILKLPRTHFDIVLASNFLEHVEDLGLAVRRLSEFVALGKYLVLSGPKNFPEHPDPIDNMFRPERWQLQTLFADFKLVSWRVARHASMVSSISTGPIDGLRKVANLVRFGNYKAPIPRFIDPLLPVSAWVAVLQKV